MPHAYIVGQIRIKDSDLWADYCNKVPATLEPWNAELMFRGKNEVTFAGETPYTNIVVIRFPDITTAKAWHDSEAYQALVPLRESAADVLLSGFEASQ
ncbi:MAG: DUF1330 domain-containing protein [Marinospirillum sp.]|uniref:DUF1330 domain-containing protein n=1 Tax=Marinospirillum sp. TaxID=2183934 RepID=UPI001A05D90D|nr:DUF1330 domain-containing protein [Marinospirillum sp.]MBE0508330.1 DUF1330 domain-containing protein [Marinospirillum sp.]